MKHTVAFNLLALSRADEAIPTTDVKPKPPGGSDNKKIQLRLRTAWFKLGLSCPSSQRSDPLSTSLWCEEEKEDHCRATERDGDQDDQKGREDVESKKVPEK